MSSDDDAVGGPVDLPGGWVVEAEWPRDRTHGGPRSLVIRPATEDGSYPAGGINSTVLRDVGAAVIDSLRRQAIASNRLDRSRAEYDKGRDSRIQAELKNGITETYLALLASRYVQLTNQGQADPLQALAGITDKSRSTVKGHLWQARRRSLLDGSPGRAGGTLTDRASALIRKHLEAQDIPVPEPLTTARPGSDGS